MTVTYHGQSAIRAETAPARALAAEEIRALRLVLGVKLNVLDVAAVIVVMVRRRLASMRASA